MSSSRRDQPTASTPRRNSSHPPPNPSKDGDAPRSKTAAAVTTTAAQTPNTSTNFRASAPPGSHNRYTIRTPGSQVLDFHASARSTNRKNLLFSAGGGAGAGGGGGRALFPPTQFTPHGRAAIRALDSRRAAIAEINTPGGRNNHRRRRSVRDQRETPRDVLRALSKTLAPKSKRISSGTSSSGDSPEDGSARQQRAAGAGGSQKKNKKRRAAVTIPEDPDGDSDDEFPIDRPRFSLPIDEDADSDGELPRPPRSSGLEDLEDNFTMQSIEMPRRATMNRYSMRMSDYGALSDDGDAGVDPAFFPQPDWGADDEENTEEAAAGAMDATLERIDDEARRDTMGGRISDFGAIDFTLDAGDQSTIMLAPQVQSSPEREGYSPENEPFGLEDEPPPAFGDDMDVDEDDAAAPTGFEDDFPPLDLAGGQDDDDDDDDDGVQVGDYTAADDTVLARQASRAAARRLAKPGKKVSKHGIQYPSLPTSVVKRLAQRFAGKTKLNSETLATIMQASDWFFEQLGEDLQAYANHAKRRTTINESDMLTLMKRQRQTSASMTPFALAQRHLPRELLQELRMPVPAPVKKRRQKRANPGGEDQEEGA